MAGTWITTGMCPKCGGQIKAVDSHQHQELEADPNVPDQFTVVREWTIVDYACQSCDWIGTS